MDPGNACAQRRRSAAAIAAVAAGMLLECLASGTVGAALPPVGPGVGAPALAASILFAGVPSVPPPPVGDDSLEEFAPSFDPSNWDSVTAAWATMARPGSARSRTLASSPASRAAVRGW